MKGVGARGGGSRFLYEPFDVSADRERGAYEAILRALGTPEQVQEKVIAIEELIEEKRRRDWLFRSIRTVGLWAAAVAAGWLAFKGLLVDVMSGVTR